ncbi:hypothetical protein [Rufibacter sp. XAAS-G3-1]|uniref:hypothetical protein n=1 Tax=Rufibacter sp. XAAS-G3-1 TaxID=2729134 RepID=UPI0015E6FC84|nr:hypothetical protein [Rufibacter sp. XAAS-G3-1]
MEQVKEKMQESMARDGALKVKYYLPMGVKYMACKWQLRLFVDAAVYTSTLCGGVLLLFPAHFIISVFDLISGKQPENRRWGVLCFLFFRSVLA